MAPSLLLVAGASCVLTLVANVMLTRRNPIR